MRVWWGDKNFVGGEWDIFVNIRHNRPFQENPKNVIVNNFYVAKI